MRKIIFASLLSILTIYAFGQEEGKFRGNAGLGVAIPSGGAGFLFNMEGNYNITDNFNAGVRIGWAIMAKNIETDEDGFATEADVGANASYLATAEYFFPTGSAFTPYVGAGLGLYRLASVNTAAAEDVSSEGKFGFMLRGGFEAGKFRFTAEYNIIGKTELEDLEGDVIADIPNSYLGISVGMFFGGGRW